MQKFPIKTSFEYVHFIAIPNITGQNKASSDNPYLPLAEFLGKVDIQRQFPCIISNKDTHQVCLLDSNS